MFAFEWTFQSALSISTYIWYLCAQHWSLNVISLLRSLWVVSSLDTSVVSYALTQRCVWQAKGCKFRCEYKLRRLSKHLLAQPQTNVNSEVGKFGNKPKATPTCLRAMRNETLFCSNRMVQLSTSSYTNEVHSYGS